MLITVLLYHPHINRGARDPPNFSCSFFSFNQFKDRFDGSYVALSVRVFSIRP